MGVLLESFERWISILSLTNIKKSSDNVILYKNITRLIPGRKSGDTIFVEFTNLVRIEFFLKKRLYSLF